MTETHVCEQLVQSCYGKAEWPGVESVTFESQVQQQPLHH